MSNMTRTLTLAVAMAAVGAAGAVASANAQSPRGNATPATGQAAAPSDAASADAVAIATRFIDRFDAGEFEAARADFSPEMITALDAGKLATVSTQRAQAGAARARSAPRVMQHDGYEVVVITVDRTAAKVDATISIDGDGKVAGVYFLPTQPAAPAPGG